MQELGACIGQDVKSKLKGICAMSRVDVGSQLLSFHEMRQELEQRIRNASNAADDRILDNNNRKNHQENC